MARIGHAKQLLEFADILGLGAEYGNRIRLRQSFPVQDPYEVIAELGFTGPRIFPLLAIESGLLELRDHAALAEPAQISPAFSQRDTGSTSWLSRQSSASFGQLLFDFYCLLFRLAEDMGGVNFLYHDP